jgi:hypothetical protein
MVRTVSGARSMTRVRSWMPFIPGICISATTTAYGPWRSNKASASSPPKAISIAYCLRRLRCYAARMLGSSSTHRTLLLIGSLLLPRRLAPPPPTLPAARQHQTPPGRRGRARGAARGQLRHPSCVLTPDHRLTSKPTKWFQSSPLLRVSGATFLLRRTPGVSLKR